MPVELSEIIFEKIDKYYHEEKIVLEDNLIQKYLDDNENQIEEKEIKMSIPVNLDFTFEELNKFINEKDNQFILLDFFQCEFTNFHCKEPDIRLIKNEQNYEITCKYENFTSMLDVMNEMQKEKILWL